MRRSPVTRHHRGSQASVGGSSGTRRGGCGAFMGCFYRRAILTVLALKASSLFRGCSPHLHLGARAASAAATEEAGTTQLGSEETVGGPSVAVTSRTVVPTSPPPLFSPEWEARYRAGAPGCGLARGSFKWRPHGFGSNINNMLNAWVYAIAVEKWSDLALTIDEHQMGHIRCEEESSGEASSGWDCLFRPMPHLCKFGSEEAWEEHLVMEHAERADLAEAVRLDQDAVRFHPEEIGEALEGSGIDHLGALAVMARYLWSYITPWMLTDILAVSHAPAFDVFNESPFLGLHIRRGDKIYMGEALPHSCEEYMVAAVGYLRSEESQLSVEDIRGIWVASDNSSVVDRIKVLAPKYLPNVDNSAIVWASGGVEGGPVPRGLSTRTDHETYAGAVYTLADLLQCTMADVFVGTFSSNMGRLLVLLRESVGLKTRSSAVSVDVDAWYPGRR